MENFPATLAAGVSGELLFQNHFFLFSCLICCFYVHSKQLRSCWEGQLLNHTVPGQASQKQFTSI